MENSIKTNYNEVAAKLAATAEKFGRAADEIRIIAVSKTHPADALIEGAAAGITIFGENYVQELVEKQKILQESKIRPTLHFIGHLQSNKVKYIAPFIDMIHSVDSLKLAMEISKQAGKNDRDIEIMLQINTSGEESKSGCEPSEAVKLADEIIKLPHIKLKGMMTIGTFSDDETVIRREFRLLKKCRDEVNAALNLNLKELSMGMSHDFDIAIEEGSTMVRVGTAIFGMRDYSK